MIRPPIRLSSATQRQFCASYVLEAAPDGCVVQFKENTRSLEQNSKLHAMIDEVAAQVTWYGRKLPAWKWKRLFVAALGDAEIVPGIDEGSFVPMWRSTTELSVPEARDLIELIYAFGARQGVVFKDPPPLTEVRR